MAEGACILSGIGFHGYKPDGTARWDRVTNVSPAAFETAQNNRELLEAWNQNTNKWLKNYVYLRVTPLGKKPGFRSGMATFITSAVWHGFYPGYYLTFISAGLVQTCGKCIAVQCRTDVDYRRHLRPFFLDPDLTTPTKYKKYYDFVCWVVIISTYNYIVQPFIILTIWDSLRLWGRLKVFSQSIKLISSTSILE
jgi:lysophospholipid acyltransferase